MNTRPIDIELQRGGKIHKALIRIDADADLTTINTTARQIAFYTGSSKVRVCVGGQWSSWLTPLMKAEKIPNDSLSARKTPSVDTRSTY